MRVHPVGMMTGGRADGRTDGRTGGQTGRETEGRRDGGGAIRWRLAVVALALVAGCASQSEEPEQPTPAETAATYPDSLLHVGATVRVRGPRLGRGWRVGTVVVSAGRHPCLAIKILPMQGLTPLYLTAASFSRVDADQRTNQGALTVGLPPAQESDWVTLPLRELRRRDAACRRRK